MTSSNAHAALIDDGGIVREVIVIPHMEEDDDKITAYCHSIGLSGRWIDTSYVGARRAKFAGIGDVWDGEKFTTPGATNA